MEAKLRQLMKHEGLNSTRLAEMLGIQASGISHIMSGRNKPSFDFLLKLLQRFPQINPDWLLLDKGPMYRDEIKNKSQSLPLGSGVRAGGASVSARGGFENSDNESGASGASRGSGTSDPNDPNGGFGNYGGFENSGNAGRGAGGGTGSASGHSGAAHAVQAGQIFGGSGMGAAGAGTEVAGTGYSEQMGTGTGNTGARIPVMGAGKGLFATDVTPNDGLFGPDNDDIIRSEGNGGGDMGENQVRSGGRGEYFDGNRGHLGGDRGGDFGGDQGRIDGRGAYGAGSGRQAEPEQGTQAWQAGGPQMDPRTHPQAVSPYPTVGQAGAQQGRNTMPPPYQPGNFTRSASIERIVVFYKDKTFSEYQPE